MTSRPISPNAAGRRRSPGALSRTSSAAPVQTCTELADRHREHPTATVKFEARENDGWSTECFAPTWFAFDGEPLPRGQPPRASAPMVRQFSPSLAISRTK